MNKVDDEADAIKIANDTPYGLTNYVQTQDGPRRNRMALALKAGMIEMNGQDRGAGSPFGGMKMSGQVFFLRHLDGSRDAGACRIRGQTEQACFFTDPVQQYR